MNCMDLMNIELWRVFTPIFVYCLGDKLQPIAALPVRASPAIVSVPPIGAA